MTNSNGKTIIADIGPLARHWVHSHEEDRPEYQAFRPLDFSFPPSRGRRAFDIRADGTVTFYDIAAADGPGKVEGSWHAEGASDIVIRFKYPSRAGFKLH